jgi:glycosyltransferase involved in cell wall biosynthesis
MGRLRPAVPNRLLHNGTPLREVAVADAQAARAELGAGEGDTLIGVFGRLQRWKGQDVFIEAARRIASDRPRTRFAIVGGSEIGFEADYLEEIKRAAGAPELRERLIFTGFRDDVPRLMAACDVVCHTSRVPEPFGLVLIEAMALGRAVIATAGGGPSEIISSPVEGILVPPDDAGALARAVKELIDDPERRRALGEGGRARVRSQFSIDVMASTMIRYLDEMLAA